jgi:MoaA/NifB/PqqE/SkfB family radical SAM enzyme
MPVPSTDEAVRKWPLQELRELHLEMGKQCNVRCAMCYQTDFSPASRLPDIVWKKRLLEAYPTAERLTLSGGEPTIMRNCSELLSMVMRSYPNLGLNVVTNGLRFNGIWEEAFLKQGEFLNFSLNAIAPELYRRIVQFGNQATVIENIDRMVRRRNETQSKLMLRISTVAMDSTIDELPMFVKWAVDHGLDQALIFADHLGHISMNPGHVQKRIAEAYEISDQNPQVKLLHLDDFDWLFASQHGIAPVRPRTAHVLDPKPCPVAFDTLFVNPDGTAKPCCKSWYFFGNLVRESLPAVWNSCNAFRFRKRMIALDFRDCLVVCDLNACPINPRYSQVRKAAWVVRRDPRAAVKKGLRRLGLTSAQIDMPVSETQ